MGSDAYKLASTHESPEDIAMLMAIADATFYMVPTAGGDVPRLRYRVPRSAQDGFLESVGLLGDKNLARCVELRVKDAAVLPE